MSNIKKAVVRFNGQELVATYDANTQLWTATATAPATSSYGQPDHVYKAEVFAQDQAGNSATVNSSDPTYGAQLKIRVLEKTKPEGQIRTPSNGSVLGANTQNVVIATDSLGKTTQVIRNVTIDVTKPVITDIHASTTTVGAGGRIVFTFKVTDANV